MTCPEVHSTSCSKFVELHAQAVSSGSENACKALDGHPTDTAHPIFYSKQKLNTNSFELNTSQTHAIQQQQTTRACGVCTFCLEAESVECGIG
eukprot:6342386-Amphidinium_carterae.1